MAPAILLWDFGDTLVDERWMLRAPAGYPEWSDAWRAVMVTHAARWDTGKIVEADVVAALVERTGMNRAAITAHVDACCHAIERHPRTWRVAAEHRLPQALVTVNPDLFVRRVVPALGLTSMFDAIVVSSVEGTDDKVGLCEIALERVGPTHNRRDALLIDNRRDLVDAWEASGGHAYWYRDDATFAADAPSLLQTV